MSSSPNTPRPQAPLDPEKVLRELQGMSDDEAIDALEEMLTALNRELGKAQA